MAGILRVPRSRGALSGVLLILLGAWGALIPLVGPYFHYAYTPDTAWHLTSGRIWLEIAPGVVTVIGGFIVLVSGLRPVAMFGAWLAACGGAWFAVGITLSPLWTRGGVSAIGSPVGGKVVRAVEQIGFFTGLGLVIAFVAAVVIGRLSVVGVRDARLAESRDARYAASRGPDEDEALPVEAGSGAAGSPAATSSAYGSAARGSAVTDSAAGRSAVRDRAADDAAVEDPVVYDSATDSAAAHDSAAHDSAAGGGTSATRAGPRPG
jgi:hypothetical protein